jgi:hypothetical protein
LNFDKAFLKSDVRFLGFADQQTALFVIEKQNTTHQGEIIRWDIPTSKVTSSLPLSPWISAFSLRLSPDGKYLASVNVPSAKQFDNVKVYRVSVFNSSNFTSAATYEVAEKEDCAGVLFVPGEQDKVVLKMRSLIPFEDTYTYGKNRLDTFDIKTQKIVRTVSYSPGFEVDRIVPSSDGKSWLMLYYSFFFNNFGEAGLDEEQDRGSVIDVINPNTGKIEWHITSTNKLSVGDPVIPFSPQEFVSSASIFNRASRTSRPWAVSKLRPSPSSPISEVPGKPQFIVIETKTGIKIRNWVKGKDIKSWQLKGKTGRTFFSPNLKTIGYKQGQQISFFNFDPTLLKP